MGIYGILMRWILSVKDHSSRMTVLAALPLKQAKFVLFELDYLFGLLGYPSIFHTDNGTEFVAKELVAGLKEVNPSLQTVTGRARKPSDQGSVENGQRWVKEVIKN